MTDESQDSKEPAWSWKIATADLFFFTFRIIEVPIR
jgi:hypothetical protein